MSSFLKGMRTGFAQIGLALTVATCLGAQETAAPNMTNAPVATATASSATSSVPAAAPTATDSAATASSSTGGRSGKVGVTFDEMNRSVISANIESPLRIVASDKDALDLQQCFQIAAVRSDTLQISAQDIQAAQARLSQAIAQIYPTFNLVGALSYEQFKNNSRGININSTGSGFSTSNNQNYSSSSGVSMSQTLFNGFANYNAVGAASAGVEAQRYNLARGYQTLYSDVAQAFYQILTNEGDLIILADSVKALEGRQKELQERVRIGRSRPAELLQAQADLASTRVTIEETKGMLAAARELMAFYLGIPSEKIKLRETQKFPSADTLEKYLSTMGIRPDILALVETERQAARNVSVAKGALFPQVTASGTYNLTSDPASNQDWVVGLQVQLPIFDGGLIVSQIHEQKALQRQSGLNLDNLRRSADQDVRTAYANFNSSAAQVVRLNEEVELAALSYNAQAADYKAGIVSNLDVLVALNNLENSRLQLHSADLSARLNLIKLHVAAGLAAKSLPGAPSPGLPDSAPAPSKKAKP